MSITSNLDAEKKPREWRAKMANVARTSDNPLNEGRSSISKAKAQCLLPWPAQCMLFYVGLRKQSGRAKKKDERKRGREIGRVEGRGRHMRRQG